MCKVPASKTSQWSPSYLDLAWVNKGKDNTWDLLYELTSCRTYMSDYLCAVQIDTKYPQRGEWYVKPCGKLVPLDKEYTSIFFCEGTYGDKFTNVDENLKILNKLEKKYGITPTIYEHTSEDSELQGIVFIGDADWHSNIWKQTLYTFYLKCLLNGHLVTGFENAEEYNEEDDPWDDGPESDGNYWIELHRTGVEETLLSKIKTCFEEKFKKFDYENVHVLSGFVSIIIGKNDAMYQILFNKGTK